MATTPFVYPLFMTDGWFTQSALPERLGIAPERILAPLGLTPRLPDMATAALRTIARQQGWQVRQTDILVAAHGSASGRSKPAQRAYQFAQALSHLADWKQVEVGFLEQQPRLFERAGTCGPKAICVPFFAAGGYHVSRDIREDLRKGGFVGRIADPVGRAAYIPQLIADALQNAVAASTT